MTNGNKSLLTEDTIRVKSKPFAEIGATYDDRDPPPRERKQILDGLNILGTLENNWNGYEAAAPNARAIETAKIYIILFPFGKMFPTKVYPGTDGCIVMEWERADIEGRILLTIDPFTLGFVQIHDDNRIQDLGDVTLGPDTEKLPLNAYNHLPHYRATPSGDGGTTAPTIEAAARRA